MKLQELQDLEKKNPDLTDKMKGMLEELDQLFANPVVEAAYNNAIAHVYPYVELEGGADNPWVGQSSEYFRQYFRTWFTYLPRPIAGEGLGKIIPFSYFYLNNPTAREFLNTFKSRCASTGEYKAEIFDWVVRFVKERGAFMDSINSKKYVEEWTKALGHEMKDFVVPKGGFDSFNAFFTRELNSGSGLDPRPISDPKDDSIPVAPADSVLNYIISDLTLTQELNIKSRQINVSDLFNGSPYAACFEGGTAISCVLLPQNYHHFHAPVTGKIIEAVEVPGRYFGIVDGGEFTDNFNFGQGTADFSVFEDFHRAYYLIDTEKHGLVGLVPVGLNTISRIQQSLNFGKEVKPGDTPVPVTKGEKLGSFAYGGSLCILFFQKGVFSAVSVFMGTRLGVMQEPSVDAPTAK